MIVNDVTANTGAEKLPPGRGGRGLFITGWILTVLPGAMLLFSAAMKFSGSRELTEGMEKFGYAPGLGPKLGVVELVCTLLYLVPQTSVLGAILLTGYLGGATATHVRIGDPFFMPIVIGVVIWAGLFLRDSRLRALLPLRRRQG
jgi:hypothetical protein